MNRNKLDNNYLFARILFVFIIICLFGMAKQYDCQKNISKLNTKIESQKETIKQLENEILLFDTMLNKQGKNVNPKIFEWVRNNARQIVPNSMLLNIIREVNKYKNKDLIFSII